MATVYWNGTATAVAQVATATFGVYDVATTRKITIGGVVISAADSGGTLTTALTALAVLLNASTHPYFSSITWTSSATQIIGTADTAGDPFTFAGSVSGGTGTVTNAYTVSTASAGPNDWSTAANWSTGAVPVSTDDVIFKDNSVNVACGFAQSAVTLTSLRIEKSYTGKIGLDRTVFATSSDGATTVSTAIEYRSTYLAISATSLRIGENYSASIPAGSSRIMIDLGTNASTMEIFGTAQSPSESGRPAIRFKCNHASTALYVRSAPGGAGIAVDAPGETSTLATISISDNSSVSRVFTGLGTTLATWYQQGGNNTLQAAATVTTVTCNGGTLATEGDYTITTLNINGGTVNSNQIKTAGNAITTLNANGGTTDATGSNAARTWATVNLKVGATVKADGSVLTITTLNDPANKYTLTAAA